MTATHSRSRQKVRQPMADASWAHALTLPQFGYAEISAGMKIGLETATRIVRGWDAAGALVAIQAGPGLRSLWKPRPGYQPPMPAMGRTPEINMWTAMRGLGAFTPTDIAAHATTDSITVAVDQAAAYCRALLAANYLRVARKADPGVREAIYRLIQNSGPRPPLERRVRAIVDGNTETITVISGVGQ